MGEFMENMAAPSSLSCGKVETVLEKEHLAHTPGRPTVNPNEKLN